MNTKKIWLTAMVFGIIAAGMMYLMVNEMPKESQPVSEPVIEEDKEKKAEGNIAAAAEMEEGSIETNERLPASKGTRAMTVEVTDVQGVAGYIELGSFVDVVVVMEVPEEQKETQHDSATLLLQNVKVLAIGHAADDQETMKRYQMVTFEVTPIEGLTLGFAASHELYLMLREEGDEELEPKNTHVHEDDLHEGVFN
ncbi:Flp pilus assembly protein CpaB [Virgibacillus sp. C22-A2]|uniref:Flp pilus assembly protein CpaB n=1 Tax=Virgibacillus tibetensis TaxID=3042313 RepID=A0ABU6KFP4_9BACI|nr:Flp pilus assembly protein CpaB [Virgibacillus sp. C22-A2]